MPSDSADVSVQRKVVSKLPDLSHNSSAQAILVAATELRKIGQDAIANCLEFSAKQLSGQIDRLTAQTAYLLEQCQMLHAAREREVEHTRNRNLLAGSPIRPNFHCNAEKLHDDRPSRQPPSQVR